MEGGRAGSSAHLLDHREDVVEHVTVEDVEPRPAGDDLGARDDHGLELGHLDERVDVSHVGQGRAQVPNHGAPVELDVVGPRAVDAHVEVAARAHERGDLVDLVAAVYLEGSINVALGT